MRAAVVRGPMDLAIEEVPVPEPGPGELRLRIDLALTGGTSAKLLRRGYHARLGTVPPFRLGHEGVGTVDAVGEGVTEWKVGDRVVPANSAACQVCEACRRGLTTQCLDMTWLTGLFADHALVPARIVAGNLHRLPDGLPPEAAALADNLAAVLKGHDRTPARADEKALVLGTGALGLLWVRLLSMAGVEVTAVGRRPDRAAKARALGAWAVLDTGELEERVARGEARADLVVEAVGTPEAWTTAVAAVKPGGRVNLFGGPPKGTTISVDTNRLHYDEILLTSSFHHTPYHFAEALHLLSRGFVDPSLLVEERIGLADLPRFFRRQFEGGGPLKAAVVPGSGGRTR